MTNLRWEVARVSFMTLRVLRLVYTVLRISIQAEGVVKHVLVLYRCRLWGASIFDTFPLIVNEVEL